MKTTLLLLALLGASFAAPQVQEGIDARQDEAVHTAECTGHGHEGQADSEARVDQGLELESEVASDVRSEPLSQTTVTVTDGEVELRQEETDHHEACTGHGHEGQGEGEARLDLDVQQQASEVRTGAQLSDDLAVELRQEEAAQAEEACSGKGDESEVRADFELQPEASELRADADAQFNVAAEVRQAEAAQTEEACTGKDHEGVVEVAVEAEDGAQA